MKRFIKQFGKGRLQGLLADHEFIGESWRAWLKSEQIDFHIRIKKDAKVPNSQGEAVQAKRLFQSLKAGEALVLLAAKTMTGVDVYLSGLRLAEGELLIVASSKACPDAIETYGNRWQIETLFGCMKGRGRDTGHRPHPHQTVIGRCCSGLLLGTPYLGMAARKRQAHQSEKAPASGEKYF